MKALTLTQPWATLMAIGAKRIETRGWSTTHRGLTAIHAAKGFPPEAEAICHTEPFRSVLNSAGIQRTDELPRGLIIATAALVTAWRFNEATERDVRARSSKKLLAPHEADFGDFTAGRYGLVFGRVLPLITPVTARGMLSLWTVPPDVQAFIDAQMAVAP